MSFVDWFMASFLYCFPYSYCFSNYCDSNSCRSFTLLKAKAKSNGNLFAINYDIQGAIEKSPREKNEWFDGNGSIIISYFRYSNNIFADCKSKNEADKIKSDNFIRSNIVNKLQFDSSMIILNSGGTNIIKNIFILKFFPFFVCICNDCC